jgi:hypothetical protein
VLKQQLSHHKNPAQSATLAKRELQIKYPLSLLLLSVREIPSQIKMAEIGLIASITGLAGAGAKISITLFQIASAIGSAGSEVRFVAADTNALSLVLTNLSKTLREKRAAAQEGEQLAGAVLLMCRTVIDDSNELISHLNPLVQRTTKAPKDVLLRLTWLFQKSKFAIHRQSLEALKSTLCLLITTMSFAAAVEVQTDQASTYVFFF